MNKLDQRQLRLAFRENSCRGGWAAKHGTVPCRASAVEAFDARLPLGFLLFGVMIYGYTALLSAWSAGKTIPKISAPAWSLASSPASSTKGSAAGRPDAVKASSELRPHELFLSAKIKKINPSVNAGRLAALIVQQASRAGIDPLILGAIIKGESTFDAAALSSRGAVGLMQIMPHTARYIARRQGLIWGGVDQLQDPVYNLNLGVAYMKHLLDVFNGSYELAFLAYNWGPGNLKEALARKRTMDPAVRNYAKTLSATIGAWQREFRELRPAA